MSVEAEETESKPLEQSLVTFLEYAESEGMNFILVGSVLVRLQTRSSCRCCVCFSDHGQAVDD